MLERLEAERRRTSSAALAPRRRSGHASRGTSTTRSTSRSPRLLLRLEAARVKAPPELAHELAETKALANQAMEELLILARQLRPTALDDLGLKAALAGHVASWADAARSAPASTPGRLLGPSAGRPAGRLPGGAGGAVECRPHSGAEHVEVRLVARGRRGGADRGRRGSGSRSTRRRAGSGSRACASERCSSGGGVEVESGRRSDACHLTVPLDSADTGVARWKHNGRTDPRG